MNDRLRGWRLLVRVLFAPETPEATAALRDAIGAPGTPWLDAISHANLGNVTAALWVALCRRGVADSLGEDARAYLESFHEVNSERNRAIRAQLESCLAKLGDAGIRGLPIKGAAYLLAHFDADIGSRLLGDIDLLVPRETAQEARDVLIGDGYREAPQLAPDEADEHRHLTPLVRDDLPTFVELHTAAIPTTLAPGLPEDTLWENARRASEQTPFRVPSPTDAATLSFFHAELIDLGTELQLIRLRAFHDLHVLRAMYGAEIAWGEVAARARAVGGAKRFKRYAYVYRRLSGVALVPGMRFSPADAVNYAVSIAAIACPEITQWRLRLDRLSERRLRRRFGLEGGALQVNLYRVRRAFEMIAQALTGRPPS